MVSNITIVIVLKLILIKNAIYRTLKRKKAANSPLNNINNPETKQKKQILNKVFFFIILKKNKEK